MLGRMGMRLLPLVKKAAPVIATGVVGVGCGMAYQVKEPDFFYFEFETTKDPDAIVDFYSTEDFLQILGIFPFAIHLMLAGVDWRTDCENTMSVWNTMKISFDITEKEEVIDGKEVVTFFNKRERFIQYIPFTKILLWDQVQNYGYKRTKDGKQRVSHAGEYFDGPWLIRQLVPLHAQYVIWATEKHINSQLFATKDLEAQEEQRSNIPLYVFNQYIEQLTANQKMKIDAQGDGGTAEQRATLEKLQSMKAEKSKKGAKVTLLRRKTSIVGEPEEFSATKIRMNDPAAHKAINDAMRDVTTNEERHRLKKVLEGGAKWENTAKA